MKIRKIVQGRVVDLEIEKIKDYPSYGWYQVYKIIDGKRVPAYKETFTPLQLREIRAKGCCINEDELD